MPQRLSLIEIQSRFKELLKTPELADEDPVGIRSTESVPVSVRLDIYHYAYFARIRRSLMYDFELVGREIGEAEFEPLLRRYLERYPSRYPSLAQVGQHFPKFLAEHPLYRDRPWLAELAELEWQSCLALWSEEPEPCDFGLLMSLPDERRLEQVLLLSASTRFFNSRYRVNGEQIDSEGPLSLALFRQGGEVLEIELTPEMEELLFAIRDGETLGQLIERMEASPVLAEQGMDWITDWVAQGLITGFTSKAKAS